MGKNKPILNLALSILLLILASACQTGTPAAQTPPPLPEQTEASPTVVLPVENTPTPEPALPETGGQAASAPEPLTTSTPSPERREGSPLAGVDACELYTQAEAEAALEQAVRQPERVLEAEALFSVTSCFYTAELDSIEYTGVVLVAPANGDEDFSRATFEYSRREAANLLQTEAVNVPGLGDAAYYVGGEIRTLFVLQDSVQMHLTLSNAPQDAPSPVMVGQAQRVLSRLP